MANCNSCSESFQNLNEYTLIIKKNNNTIIKLDTSVCDECGKELEDDVQQEFKDYSL